MPTHNLTIICASVAIRRMGLHSRYLMHLVSDVVEFVQ